MRTKVTLLLIFLNVVLFGVIAYFHQGWTQDATAGLRTRVLPAEVGGLQWLELVPASGTRVSLERRGSDWFLLEPYQWAANPHAVRQIVGDLQFLEHITSFNVADLAANGQSLADYGLEQPSFVLRFGNDASARDAAIELKLGDATQGGDRLYVLSPDGARIHVVGRSLAESVARAPGEFASDQVFTIPVFEAGALVLQAKAPSNLRVRLRREGAGWKFERPILARASKADTESAINQLANLKVAGVAPGPNPDAVGLGTGAQRLTLEGNNRRETLLLGNEVPAGTPLAARPLAATGNDEPLRRLYARLESSDTVFVTDVPVRLLERLATAQESLRDRRVLEFDPAAVTSLILRAPGQPELTLQRLEATGSTRRAWQIVRQGPGEGPQTRPADTEIVTRLLDRLATLRVQERDNYVGFVNDAPSEPENETYGFTLPQREVVLTLAADPTATGPLATTPTTLTLQLGRAPGGDERVFARVSPQPFVYEVPVSTLATIPVAGQAYRDRLLRELPEGAAIVGLELRDLASDEVIYGHQLATGETWDQVLATEPAARRTAVETMLAQLRALRVQAILRETFTDRVPVNGEERPWQYALRATLALSGGTGAQAEVSTLFFAPRAGGTLQQGGSAEFGVTFEAPQPLIDALFTLTYRADPGPPAPVAPTTNPEEPASTATPEQVVPPASELPPANPPRSTTTAPGTAGTPATADATGPATEAAGVPAAASSLPPVTAAPPGP